MHIRAKSVIFQCAYKEEKNHEPERIGRICCMYQTIRQIRRIRGFNQSEIYFMAFGVPFVVH